MNIEEYNQIETGFIRKYEHSCTTQATAALRWKVVDRLGVLARVLEQAHSCRECGKYEWREVPTVEEAAK